LPATELVNREVAAKVIRGLIKDGPRNAVYYMQESVQVNDKQWRHAYRFFTLSRNALFNISGLITMLFNAKVTDRTQTYSFTQMNAEQDRAAFNQALRKELAIPDLDLDELISSAIDVLEYRLNPITEDYLNICEMENNQNPRP